MSEPKPQLVSIVVLNYNGRRHLERCLPTLFATTGVEFEVIVADNGSTDGSVEWLSQRWPQARVLALGENLGFGAANNRAARTAGGELLALLNNDTEVEPGWLAALIEPLHADPEVAAACATLHLSPLPGVLNARGGAMTSAGYGHDIDFMVPCERPPANGADQPWRDVLFPTAAAMVIRSEVFALLGGFDPGMFMYHEDVDLGLRLWLTGHRVVVCDRAIVRHAFGGTSRQARGLAWRERLGMRHNVRALLKAYRWVNAVRACARIARIWRRHHAWGQAAATCWWNLLHLPSTLLERRRVQRRKVRDEGELYRRGLITGAAWPPAPPEPPAPETLTEGAEWIETPTLRPGQHSASGRLGPGWFASEPVLGEPARWTCGLARCVLNGGRDRVGVIEAEVTLGTATAGTAVTISCNGASASAIVGTAWTPITVPARADRDGLLHVAITSAPWVPHLVSGDWDFRTLGCAVRAVRFTPQPARAGVPGLRVSVVIPTYNRWEHLSETLAALASQSYRPCEVIVVDDGSTDDTWRQLCEWRDRHVRELQLVCVHQENAKQGRARNRALEVASGDLVVFLGDDIVPDAGFLAAHVACHELLGEAAAVIGFTDWHRDKVLVTPFLEFVNRDGPQFAFGVLRDGEECPYTSFYTSNVSVPRAVLGERPFDPSFTSYGWEDVDLGYRLSRRGLRIIYHHAAGARHAHPLTMRDFLLRQRHVGQSVLALFRLHPELEFDRFMPPAHGSLAVRALIPWLPIVAGPLGLLDRLGVRLPRRLYRALALASYLAGRRESVRAEAER